MSDRTDPKVVLRDLLKSEVDASNLEGFTPDINTGWRDERLDNLLITVSNDDESARSDTGYTGLNSSARRGTVQANIWVDSNVDGVEKGGSGTNPKKLVDSTRTEVERILAEYGNDINAYENADASNYRYMSFLGSTYLPETPDNDVDPIVYRYLVNVGYEYLREF
jgi:hypothetical protein